MRLVESNALMKRIRGVLPSSFQASFYQPRSNVHYIVIRPVGVQDYGQATWITCVREWEQWKRGRGLVEQVAAKPHPVGVSPALSSEDEFPF